MSRSKISLCKADDHGARQDVPTHVLQHPPHLVPDSPSFFDLPPYQNLIDVLESRESHTVHGMNNISRLVEFLGPKGPNIFHNFFQAAAPNPPIVTAQVPGDPLAAQYQWKGYRSVGVVVSILINIRCPYLTSAEQFPPEHLPLGSHQR